MLITNASVFGEDFRFHKKNVRISGSVFGNEADTAVPFSGEPVVDAEGLLMIPGLTDLHFHGCLKEDFCNGTEEAIRTLSDFELKHGVTQICPATMTFDEERLTGILKTAAAHKNTAGADLVGINLEGPFISREKKGAQNGSYIVDPDIDFFRRLMKASGNLIKICVVAPEEKGAMEFIDALKNETVISIAHSNADYDTAMEAIAHGVTHVTHLYNAMSGFSHRSPGVLGAASDSPTVMAEMICDGVHIHPSAVRAAFKLLTDDRIILISDSMEATGLTDGEYSLGGQPVNVRGNRATLTDGTIAGSVTSLFDCMKTAVREMKIPLESAVKCAAVNPAKRIGIFDRYGSIEPGKKANFLLIDPEVELKTVYKDGVKVH